MTPAPGDLVEAAKCRDTQGVMDLLEQGADPNERDEDGETPLIWTACYGQTNLVKLLLEKGADIDGRETGTDRTALMYVVRNACFIPFGYEPCLRLLIERGASLDTTDNKGMTALDWAKKENNHDAARILQEAMDQQRLIAAEKAAREAEQKRVNEQHKTTSTRQDALKKRNSKLQIRP